MGLSLDPSLSSYAQAAGVDPKDLNDSSKAQDAADKILAAVGSSPSADKAADEAAIVLDAQAFDEGKSTSKDTFSQFEQHVSQFATNSSVSTDLQGLASMSDVAGDTHMAQFAQALANTYHGATSGQTLQSMSSKGGGWWKGIIHHDANTVSTSIGTGSSAYQITFEQRNSGSNVLTVKDPNGNTVSLPASLKGGNAAGTMTVDGATISISGSGPNVNFTVTDGEGNSQTAEMHGAGDKGSLKLDPMNQGATSGSTGSGTVSGSTTSGSMLGGYSPETDLDPLWVASTESVLANEYQQKYGVPASVFEDGASDEWIQGSNMGQDESQMLSGDAQDTGLDQEVYEAGENFANHYKGDGTSDTPSTPAEFNPLPSSSAASGTGGTSGTSGAATTQGTSGTSGAATTQGSGGSSGAGAPGGGAIAGQDTQLDPTVVANLETQWLNQIPSQYQDYFNAAIQDVWGQEFNKGASSVSPEGQAYQAGQLSSGASQAYKLGAEFADKYYGGGSQTTPT